MLRADHVGGLPRPRWQPEARYWHFQFIEAGWLLALCVLLIAVTIWLVRRRAA